MTDTAITLWITSIGVLGIFFGLIEGWRRDDRDEFRRLYVRLCLVQEMILVHRSSSDNP